MAEVDSEGRHLTNDDFRRLLMTPRPQQQQPEAPPKRQPVERRTSTSETKKVKKKNYQNKVPSEVYEREAELNAKYRDRAKERRAGDNPDYKGTEEPPSVADISSYKHVAPSIHDMSYKADIRKKAIQESKFLGGDLQHTHLVKGLDYVLLDKVRAEQESREHELEQLKKLEQKREKERARRESQEITFKSSLAKNVYRTLFMSKPPEKNEQFAPRRMAYVYDLEDEYSQTDIPTTLLRSRAECPTQQVTTLTTNDIVINKLTQILSYLRQGSKQSKKSKKKEKPASQTTSVPGLTVKPRPGANQSIFDDIGEYKPDLTVKTKGKSKSSSGGYFSKHEEDTGPSESTEELVKAINAKYSQENEPSYLKLPSANVPPKVEVVPEKPPEEPKPQGVTGLRRLALDSHYQECYPGGIGDYDANYDSDEDADFTKMDLGSKKGPVKRWDFDNEEDYSNYQSHREALPKAAFQYGVKMGEGRKTRRYGGGPGEKKNKEKAKLDREWQQISKILDKRGKSGGGSSAKKQKLDS